MVELPFVTAQSHAPPHPPIGIIEAISKGFEAVTNRLGLILLPVLLDLLLWLGPRLSVQTLFGELLKAIQLPPGTDAEAVKSLETLRQVSLAFAGEFNLFSILDTTPLGIPSLMASRPPTTSPLGTPLPIQVTDPLVYLSLMVALYLAGLLLGAVYLALIAQQAWDSTLDLSKLGWSLFGLWGRLLVLAIVTAPVFVCVQLLLLMLLSPSAGALPIIGLTLATWLMTYLVFSLHGLVEGRGVFRSIVESLRLVQWNLPSTLGLIGIVLVLNWGLGVLWNSPKDDSWLRLIGIVGHGYLVTALFSATFIFYRDRHRWLSQMRALAATQGAKAGRQAKR